SLARSQIAAQGQQIFLRERSFLTTERGIAGEPCRIRLNFRGPVCERHQFCGKASVTQTAVQSGGRLSDLLYRREEQPEQNRDNRDDDEQLDARKPCTASEREPWCHSAPRFVEGRRLRNAEGMGQDAKPILENESTGHVETRALFSCTVFRVSR